MSVEKTSVEVKEPRKQRPFYGYGKNRYAIYPDDRWKASWGPKPLLGHVTADDSFYAVREAYSRGLITTNFTFDVVAEYIGPVVRQKQERHQPI